MKCGNYQAIAAPALSQLTHQVENQFGAYIQDQLRLGHWALQLGAREDWTTADTDDRDAGTSTDQASHAFTWRAGLLYLFDNGIAPYVSYSTSFQPTTGTDAAGQPFVPTKGQQYEVGVKYQPRGFDGFFTASTFQVKQQNVLTTDPDNPLFNVQTGEVRVRGLELEAHVQLMRGLKMIASYTYLNDVVTAANDGTQGKRPAMIPTQMATLWLDYTLQSQRLHGLGFGAGVRYVGPSYGAATDSFRVPGVVLVDAAAHYDLDHWRFALNVDNLALRRHRARRRRHRMDPLPDPEPTQAHRPGQPWPLLSWMAAKRSARHIKRAALPLIDSVVENSARNENLPHHQVASTATDDRLGDCGES